MSNQPKAAARNTDPDTSHEAAASVDVQRHADLVLQGIGELYGQKHGHGWLRFTAAQVVENLTATHAISPSSVRSRIKELRENGYLEYVDGEQAYSTRSGRRHRLLRVTMKGHKAYYLNEKVVIKRTVSRETLTVPFDFFEDSDSDLGTRIAEAIADPFLRGKLKIQVIQDEWAGDV